MSRDPYSSRDMVDFRMNDVELRAENAQSLLFVGKLLVEAIGVLARAVADVADATRER